MSDSNDAMDASLVLTLEEITTLAQEGGMSQELIARWSGRKDMAQNGAYDLWAS